MSQHSSKHKSQHDSHCDNDDSRHISKKDSQCECLCKPSGNELVLLASTLAITIAKDLNADDTNVLAGFITALGDNLAILATAKENETKG